jgi:hypothetical protein
MLVTVFHRGHGSRLDKYQLNVAGFVLMRMFPARYNNSTPVTPQNLAFSAAGLP